MQNKSMMKKMMKGAAIGISIVLLLTLLPGKNVSADNVSDIQKSIREKQSQIKAEQEEKNRIKNNISDVKKLKEQLEKSNTLG